jgi:hypothetical protein
MCTKKATKYARSERTCRESKESIHLSLVEHPISEPSLDISLFWVPIIAAEVRKLKLHPV